MLFGWWIRELPSRMSVSHRTSRNWMGSRARLLPQHVDVTILTPLDSRPHTHR
jgi:hypothetical protein